MRVLSYLTLASLVLSGLPAHAAGPVKVTPDHPVLAVQDTETPQQRDARMAWWRAARFGMFVHWGVYSVPAGTWQGKQIGGGGEWIMNLGQIPVAVYKTLPAQFDPTKFDADTWVSIAKAAGMKYIVITAKHHDGFAMFKSKVNSFNIVDATPFKRDPLKELAAACQKQGIKLGFYYSQDQDWTAPGGAAMRGHWDKAQAGDFATYFETKALPQMEELLNNYQPAPAVIWFDTPTGEMTSALAAKMVELLNKHPNIIWNNRLGGGYEGDTKTPEQSIPANGFPGSDWETCMTINGTWGYKAYDQGFKSTEELLHNLIDIASSGGNYLLNVGPDATGTIPQPEVDRLLAMGKWLKVNGEAIYGTQAGPFPRKPLWGRITQRPGKLYLSVFDWPKDGKLFVPMSNQVTGAYLLAQPETKFTTASNSKGVTVRLTGDALDPIATVVVLDIKGAPQVIDTPLAQADDGTMLLDAYDATIEGHALGLAGTPPDLEDWVNESDYPHWKIRVTKPGKFKVSMNYALQAGSQSSTMTLTAGDQTLSFPAPPTGQWATYKRIDAGTITIDKTGPNDIVLKGKKGDGQGVLNLRDVTLTPTS